MGIIDQFQQYLSDRGCGPELDMAVISQMTKGQQVQKRQQLVVDGDMFMNLVWVGSGCLRLYLLDREAEERVVDIAVAGQFIADRIHLYSGSPARFCIEALKDSEVLLIPVANLRSLEEAVPGLERVFRLQRLNAIARFQSRIALGLSPSAEERVRMARAAFPEIVANVPLNQLANFLGINPATLSRVRSKYDASPEAVVEGDEV